MSAVQFGMAEEKACCFPIPRGARSIAHIECFFVGVSLVGIILGFASGTSIFENVISLIFLIGLGLAAFFLNKSVPEANPRYCLPYAIVKIIHLIFQGIAIVLWLFAVIALIAITTQKDVKVKDGSQLAVAISAVALALFINVAWFIFGIIGVVVAFKTRNFLRRDSNKMDPPPGVVIQQPAYVQPPASYAPQTSE